MIVKRSLLLTARFRCTGVRLGALRRDERRLYWRLYQARLIDLVRCCVVTQVCTVFARGILEEEDKRIRQGR